MSTVDVMELKQRLENLSAEEWEDLKATILYRRLRGQLRSDGWANLFLGLFTLWIGLSAANQTIFSLIQAIGGMLTVVVSLLALTRISLTQLRLFAALFVLAGIWNLFLAIRGNFTGAVALVGFLGIAQLWWASRFHRRYQIYINAGVDLSPKTVELHDKVYSTLKNVKSLDDTDYLELQIYRRRWKGFLLGDKAILAYKHQPYLTLADKADFVMLTRNPDETNSQAWRDVALQVEPEITTVGRIQNKYFERYLQWKDNTNVAGELIDKMKSILNLRHVVRIVSILILIAFGCVMVFAISILVRYS